jgi:hypothetical protein
LVSQSVEVLKPRSLLIKLSPWTRGPKNYSGPQVLTSYFYFYVRFHAATVVVDVLIKMSPRTRGPKNYSGPWVLTSYFYFYVRFCAATAVADGGGIFGIWRVGKEIWVRFFWAKGLGGSWFLFFSWRGGGGGGGVLGVLIGGSELEWEMRRTGWGESMRCIMHRVHTSFILKHNININFLLAKWGVMHSEPKTHQNILQQFQVLLSHWM